MITAVALAVCAPVASALSSSPADPGASTAAQGSTSRPLASIAQSPIYSVPPTSDGALGISKNNWGKASDVANGIAAGAALVAVYSTGVAAGAALPTFGLSVPTAGTVALVAGSVSAVSWGLGAVFSYLSRDPADRRFRTIFKPVLAHLPPIHVASARFAKVGSTLHAYLQSELRLTEFATAFVTSVNRVTGARAAHSTRWAHRQRKAAAKYARDAAKLLFRFERQRDAIDRALVAAGVSVTLPAQQVGSSQSQLARQGLPGSLKRLLKELTKGSVAPALKRRILNFSAFKHMLTKAAPQTVPFPASLPAPSQALVEDSVAGALIGYANSVH